jgi:hypothetical protein
MMKRYTVIITLFLLLIAVLGVNAANGADWEKDLKNLKFPLTPAQIMEEMEAGSIGAASRTSKHPDENVYDMLWSTDSLTDDVNGIYVTDAAHDLDNDGIPEIIAADEDGNLYVYESNGDNSFDVKFHFQDAIITTQLYTPVTVSDLDGDGNQEIVVGFYNSGNVYFFEWDGITGSDNYSLVKTISFTQGAVRGLAVDNLDSDVNQEIVIAASDTTYVYEADDTFTLNMETKVWGLGDFSIMDVGTGDLNNNGVKEFFFSHFNNVSVYIYENTGEDTYAKVFADSTEFQLDPVTDGVMYGMTLADLDDDGFPELYGGSSTGKLVAMEMQSASWDTSAANIHRGIIVDLTTAADINDIVAGDGDEDGLPDLYFGTDDNHVYDYEFLGGNFLDPAAYVVYDLGELSTNNAEKLAYGPDLDLDGEKDLVVGYEGTLVPFMFFLEHHVTPAEPSLWYATNSIIFDHVWDYTTGETVQETIALDNIGTVDCVVDSVVADNAAFSFVGEMPTIPALSAGSFSFEFAPTAAESYNVTFIVYSNSNTSPDTITAYASSKTRPELYINEFQAKDVEWIEIINAGADSIDLDEIGITTGRNTYTPYSQFGQPDMHLVELFALDAAWGARSKIGPGEIIVNMATGLDLNNSQDWIYIVYPDSGIIDRVSFGATGPAPLHWVSAATPEEAGSGARTGFSGNMGNDWTADFSATPGLPNDAPAAQLGQGIIINEVDYDRNVDGLTEWIEFYNPTDNPIDMAGYIFGDGDDIFIIDSVIVPAHGVATWTNAALSISSGDVAYIYDSTGVRYDQMGFISSNPIVQEKALTGTLQRIPDGAGPNDGYDYWTSGGDATLYDRPHTIGSLNNMTYVIFSAQVGGESAYRSFWVNGSWDANGMPDGNWSGPMLELKNDGVWPDTSATDSTFTGVISLMGNYTYDWWVGSEDNTNSWLENGASVTPDSIGFIYTETCVVDPSDAGFNTWTIGIAGDVINGWNNSEDNLVRDGSKWSGEFDLPAGPMDFKFVVMHSWSAAYGNGGVGDGIPNYTFNVQPAGTYRFTFDDADNSLTIDTVATGLIAGNKLPREFVVYDNYPNPLNPVTTIKFGVPEAARVSISIYNLLGQQVARVVDSEFAAGYHDVQWNGLNLTGAQVASGMYFYRFEAAAKSGSGKMSKIHKMILMR